VVAGGGGGGGSEAPPSYISALPGPCNITPKIM